MLDEESADTKEQFDDAAVDGEPGVVIDAASWLTDLIEALAKDILHDVVGENDFIHQLFKPS